jgi:hypothetical protein
MTQTTQPLSCAFENDADKDLTVNEKPEAGDSSNLLLSIFDSLNDLAENINRLDCLFQRKEEIEQIIRQKGKCETK